MAIQFAILGLLSWQPLSGYDLKKIIAGSELFYWSGNNNQIYRSLVQLYEDGLVTQQIQHQENLPAKKIYSITEKGRSELRKWAVSTAELPELRNTFLLQLAWSDQLSSEELDGLLGRYEEEIRIQLLMREEKAKGPAAAPNRTPREMYLWEKISEYLTAVYRHELDWVRQVRAGLSAF